jgi:hypothetical protein
MEDAPAPSSAQPLPVPQCFQFAQRGACAFGDLCRFAHGAGDDAAARRAAAGAPPDRPPPAPSSSSVRRNRRGDGGGGDEALNEDGEAASEPSRVVLFVTGLPACVAAQKVKKPLQRVFKPFHATAGACGARKEHAGATGECGERNAENPTRAAHFGSLLPPDAHMLLLAPPATPAVKLGCTHEGHTRGWAHVTLPAAAEAAALAALHAAPLCASTFPGATLALARITDKRDTLFPCLTREQRLQLRLDPVALHSVMDSVTADRTTLLIDSLIQLGRAAGDGGVDAGAAGVCWRVTDGCACVGGSALSFARCGRVSHVTAIESDARRAGALAHNAAVCGLADARLTVRHGDFLEEVSAAAAAGGATSEDVLFLDPPWGGVHYSAAPRIEAADLGLSGVPLAELAAGARRRGAGAAAFSTPRNYDDAGLARALTAACPGEPRHADRALPFRVEIGARVLLLALFPPPREPDTSAVAGGVGGDGAAATVLHTAPRFSFPTARLDGARMHAAGHACSALPLCPSDAARPFVDAYLHRVCGPLDLLSWCALQRWLAC